ncbi:MAG: hypothetical protein Rhims3KO_36400 [Hyphomicrobiales bacterium]
MKESKNSDFARPFSLSHDLRVAAQQNAPHKKKAPAPFSIRFTFEERARLEDAAAGMPLGAYIRQKLFDGELTPRRSRGHKPVKDHAALAKVLGALGRSRLSSNLNQIAKAAHLGALPVTPELEEELSEACHTIGSMRANLMRALGFHRQGDES